MNQIAFVFKSAPHGNSAGREGLDTLLSVSTLTEDIGVFFIGDGVFQILVGQDPTKILLRDYISTFKVLPLYGINDIWACGVSLHERGLSENSAFIFDVSVLTTNELHDKLMKYHIVLSF